eukprot:CAMPEP_0195038794 /NCGR_PEP_ID=MMETSP0326_2-20130528/78268_1 /TAXON_ID=2866 ORGANISM="Crypthecodinium cohnii, Strain Seligo" /NCGR_SAMPLE_ID=MMETSP0326_2 /ASSEMBLY_ACC=CAM_ASM_000348 /LENGTH=113 /DNA_ID=CAMNT_0040065381 /DNA_START=89 /DNA_END=427 /DNA_ORIENTATION=-
MRSAAFLMAASGGAATKVGGPSVAAVGAAGPGAVAGALASWGTAPATAFAVAADIPGACAGARLGAGGVEALAAAVRGGAAGFSGAALTGLAELDSVLELDGGADAAGDAVPA